MEMICVSIDTAATGRHIRNLLFKNGLTVHDIQDAMGFNNPQAVYKWLSGKTLPSIDNLLILSEIFHININEILVTDGDHFFVRTRMSEHCSSGAVLLMQRPVQKQIFPR